MTRNHVLFAGAALAALIAGPAVWLATKQGPDIFADCRAGAVAGGASTIGGPLSLIDGTGKTVTEADIITGPTLIYFGYTSCPDVCPLDNARNAAAVELLEQQGIIATPVFISIDPKRDTPEVMADYVSRLHPRMIGLTGSEDQVRAASQAYKTYFKANDDGTDYYLVDHTVFTYLVFPKIGFVEYFGREISPEQMAEKVACFARKEKGI
jgi:protein SCO1/2